eukprot:1155687-Pyramimonas_sp.AAC.1
MSPLRVHLLGTHFRLLATFVQRARPVLLQQLPQSQWASGRQSQSVTVDQPQSVAGGPATVSHSQSQWTSHSQSQSHTFGHPVQLIPTNPQIFY